MPWTCSVVPFSISLPRAGTLRVLVEENGEQRKLFSISAMEGDTWHRGHVTVQADTDWKVRKIPGSSRCDGGAMLTMGKMGVPPTIRGCQPQCALPTGGV